MSTSTAFIISHGEFLINSFISFTSGVVLTILGFFLQSRWARKGRENDEDIAKKDRENAQTIAKREAHIGSLTDTQEKLRSFLQQLNQIDNTADHLFPYKENDLLWFWKETLEESAGRSHKKEKIKEDPLVAGLSEHVDKWGMSQALKYLKNDLPLMREEIRKIKIIFDEASPYLEKELVGNLRKSANKIHDGVSLLKSDESAIALIQRDIGKGDTTNLGSGIKIANRASYNLALTKEASRKFLNDFYQGLLKKYNEAINKKISGH